MSSVQLDIRTLSDRLVDVVRDFILSGVIPSEEPIRQDALAAELRVSKIPLREALTARLHEREVERAVRGAHRRFVRDGLEIELRERRSRAFLRLEPDAAAAASRNA